ncbi:MAG: ABC transporter permease [Calditrichales bacterium]|nr:MAG: ABC transporter permease [Calditrichales bacterium]
MYALKIILKQRFRFMLTIGGIGLCVVLMLFLLGIYRGVADGAVDYIRYNSADLWVLQENTTNILRGTSILSNAHGYVLRDTPYLENISPVLFLLSTIRKENKSATIFLTGYEPEAKYGGPPELIAGRNIQNDDEIVLDHSFAAKYRFTVGDLLYINKIPLTVTGLSKGTNAFVIQYAFVTLKRARTIINFNSLVTCYLADVKPPQQPAQAIQDLQADLPGIAVFTHDVFLQNNIKETESGILPMLSALAVIGAIVLTVILTMILSISILEERKNYAVMKVLGAPSGYLPRLVAGQGLALTFSAYILGTLMFFPMIASIMYFYPEIGIKTTLFHFIGIFFIVIAMSLISTFFCLHKLRKIYPLEVFS